MEVLQLRKRQTECISGVPSGIPEEITESDEVFFFQVISTHLDAQQISQIVNPVLICPQQDSVLAVHWHPEHIPMNLIAKRIHTMFPNRKQELIIPTQHNVLTSYNGFAGVEVDCYSRGFNQKVQLLLHFEESKLTKADVLKKMLAHTFKYRASQLFEFMHAIIRPKEEWINIAAKQTGTNEAVIRFVQIYVKKIQDMLIKHESVISPDTIKNKILRNFFDCLRSQYGNALIDRAQAFLHSIKLLVKANFSNQYFYRTSEVIEEARRLGAGIVIPHPEQFWPILLADYDVDGYEVWNPQSQRYTEFLISVLNRKNSSRKHSERQLLVFMGDDTHMSEKVRDPKEQDPEKAGREIGYQPAWDDMNICKTLILGNFDRSRVIEEYKNRLLNA